MGRVLPATRFALLAFISALLIACSGDNDSPEPSSTVPVSLTLLPTAPPTSTPVPPTPEPSPPPTIGRELSPSFREFVREEVAPALAARDLGFFELHAVTEHIVCVPDNTPSRPGGPSCQTVGGEFDGFVQGFLQSEVFVVPLADAMASILRLWDAESAGAADRFGDSAPRIFAMGVPQAARVIRDGASSLIEDRPYYSVVLTSIVDRPEELTGSYPDIFRAAVILDWTPEGNGYVLTATTSGIATVAEGVLEFGPELWTDWEPYQP